MNILLNGKNFLIRVTLMAFTLLAVTTFVGGAQAAGDVTKGEKVFKKCKQCHMIGDGAKSRQGPHLNGVVDRPAGTIEGFRYSKALMAAAEGGLVWNEDNLAEYLKSPRKFIPKGKMAFAGLKRPEQITDLIAYLKTFE